MVLLRYLKSTKSKGITFRRDRMHATADMGDEHRAQVARMNGSLNSQAVGFADADYARNVDDRRSITGFIVYVNGGPVSWRCKSQPSVALSTMEAELMAATEVCRDAVFIRRLLEELGVKQTTPIALYSDNQACITVCENGVLPNKAKHMEVRHFYVKELMQGELVRMFYCPSIGMPADILTKPLPGPSVVRLRPFVMGSW